jgi:hypothetical protein
MSPIPQLHCDRRSEGFHSSLPLVSTSRFAHPCRSHPGGSIREQPAATTLISVRATKFEFEKRFWIICAIYFAGFFLSVFDHTRSLSRCDI